MLTRDVNNEDKEKLNKMADDCQNARVLLTSINRLTVEQYRRFYETILPLLDSIPWNSKLAEKAFNRQRFTYAYQTDLKNPLRQETSLAIDMICALYNCASMHSV